VPDTTYIVLRRLEPGTPGAYPVQWEIAAEADAPSAAAAIRHAVDSDGIYVAVPARSWRPVTVRTETQTVIRLDTPKEES
jgi:hypothetical protein